MFTKLVKSLWISGFFVIASSLVFAQNPHTATGVLRDDPNRPVNAMSQDLGVTPDQFRACFSNVNPAPRGAMPERNQKHANKAVLLNCLQKANPSITNDGLDQVMDRYRPGGRAAQ
jgi:hypothetical protein